MDVIIILFALIALALAALRWGVNSTDGISSTEWERRQRWYGFHETELSSSQNPCYFAAQSSIRSSTLNRERWRRWHYAK